jgi:hypothetical protein
MDKEKFRGRLGGPSQRDYSGLELAVKLAMAPTEVEKLASMILPIETSIAILSGMGFHLVEKLYNTTQLEDALANENRLFPCQIREFSRRAMEVRS